MRLKYNFRKLLVLLVIVFGMLFCFKKIFLKDTEFFRINLTVTKYPSFNDDTNYHDAEWIIVSNPPWSQRKLKRLADDYCKQNVLLPNVDKYTHEVIFLKETKFTPRNYTEKNVNRDAIDHHLKDIVLSMSFESHYTTWAFPDQKSYVIPRRVQIRYEFYNDRGEVSKDFRVQLDDSKYTRVHVDAVQKPGPTMWKPK